MFYIGIDHNDSTADAILLNVIADHAGATYAEVEAAVGRWAEINGYGTWTVDNDTCRIGVGITADRKGAGHQAKFLAGITR